MSKVSKEGVLTFKLKCGKEFVDTAGSNFRGLVVVGRRAVKENPTPEQIQAFDIRGLSEECAKCTCHPTFIEEEANFLEERESKTFFKCIHTYCQAELIEHPYPESCQYIGSKFYGLSFDDIQDKVIPLYKNDKGQIHTAPLLKFDMGEIYLGYKVVSCFDEYNYPEFECGTCMIDDSKEIISKRLGTIAHQVLNTRDAQFLRELAATIDEMDD